MATAPPEASCRTHRLYSMERMTGASSRRYAQGHAGDPGKWHGLAAVAVSSPPQRHRHSERVESRASSLWRGSPMTAQVSEALRLRGELLRMFTTPLDTLPPERRRNFMPTHSANWRGYRCLWEIRDDCLWLVDIEGSICTAAADPTALEQSCGGHHQRPCQVHE